MLVYVVLLHATYLSLQTIIIYTKVDETDSCNEAMLAIRRQCVLYTLPVHLTGIKRM